jgi:hypothetical protein
MGQAGRYLRKVDRGYAHYCPGCDSLHVFAVDRPFDNGARWTFNGDLEKPSFSPSMNVGDNWCHYHLTAGMLIYTPGNTGHGLSGQTLPLPELPPDYRDQEP